MKLTVFILFTLLYTSAVTFAEEEPRFEEELDIAKVFEQLTTAWRAGDGKAWADAFIEDADFTVWFGLDLKNKDQIAWGHQLIFDNFYAGTSYEFEIRRVRFLTPDIAIVHLNASIVEDGGKLPSEADTVPMAVLEKNGTDWKIVAFQNTPFAVNELRSNGDIRQFKKMAAEQGQQPQRAGD